MAALGELMREQGIHVRTGTSVSSVLIDGRQVRGVELEGGEKIQSDIVISNADPMHLYNEIDRQETSVRRIAVQV